MNERIKELRDRAAKFAEITYSNYIMATFHTNKSIEALFEEKFAELIAEECSRLAMTYHISQSPSDYEELDPYDQGCDDTASSISGTIRYTFGVL